MRFGGEKTPYPWRCWRSRPSRSPVRNEVPARKNRASLFTVSSNAHTFVNSLLTASWADYGYVGGGLCPLCSWSGTPVEGGRYAHEFRPHPGPWASLDVGEGPTLAPTNSPPLRPVGTYVSAFLGSRKGVVVPLSQ